MPGRKTLFPTSVEALLRPKFPRALLSSKPQCYRNKSCPTPPSSLNSIMSRAPTVTLGGLPFMIEFLPLRNITRSRFQELSTHSNNSRLRINPNGPEFVPTCCQLGGAKRALASMWPLKPDSVPASALPKKHQHNGQEAGSRSGLQGGDGCAQLVANHPPSISVASTLLPPSMMTRGASCDGPSSSASLTVFAPEISISAPSKSLNQPGI